jgi:hypothetical protein
MLKVFIRNGDAVIGISVPLTNDNSGTVLRFCRRSGNGARRSLADDVVIAE